MRWRMASGFLVEAFSWMLDRMQDKHVTFTELVKDKAQRLGRVLSDY